MTERDTFLCVPLSTKLMAGACLRRQRAANPEARKAMRPADRVAMGSVAIYGACKTCPMGQQVAARLGAST